MSLNVDYRPRNFDELAGNVEVKTSLKSVLNREKDLVPRSFLFTGPSGTGKTTLAFILKEVLKIDEVDFHVYNAANTRGIDTIREIDKFSKYAALKGKEKMYVLEECHKITNEGKEALLLLLEDPPKHTYFVLCTTEADKIKNTIKRRCHQCQLNPLEKDELIEVINEILEAEEVKDYPKTVIEAIAESCWGSPGQALSLLDSVINVTDSEKALPIIYNAVCAEKTVLDLCRALNDKNNSDDVKYSNCVKILLTVPNDPESVRYAILGYFTKIMLGPNMNEQVAYIVNCFLQSFMYTGKVGLVHACYLACYSN